MIRNDEDYRKALARISELVALDPEPGTEPGDELEILSILVEDYEAAVYPIASPTPLEAIEFRMEQAGLTQKDLVPYIGSKSKVSEVLAGKRSLSVSMIRSLSKGLGIPVEVLIQREDSAKDDDVAWGRLPIKEMIARQWIAPNESRDVPTLVSSWLQSFGWSAAPAFRIGTHVRSGRGMDEHALLAWSSWAAKQAGENPPPARYRDGLITPEFLTQLAKLSVSEEGPLRARDVLRSNGIGLIVVEHLPRTYLDGALLIGKFPVVALTLRYDRIDSFWFTLMHELAHLVFKCQEDEVFIDDLDVDSDEDCEIKADQLAGEALIPKDEWRNSPASSLRSPEAAEHLAHRLGIHPAIVAGKIRYEYRDYRKLNRMVGQGKVRNMFANSVEEKAT